MFREAFQISAVYLLVLMGVRNCSARTLQQSFASAVSVSGGSGPFGNCGSTQTIGNAAAFASGPPCAGIIPAPPPSTGCPASTVVLNWGSQATYPPLTLCPGSTLGFQWNSGTPSKVFGLYRIPSTTCPSNATATGVDLIVTPASAPNTQGVVNTTLNAPGQYYFTDLANCAKGMPKLTWMKLANIQTPPLYRDRLSTTGSNYIKYRSSHCGLMEVVHETELVLTGKCIESHEPGNLSSY